MGVESEMKLVGQMAVALGGSIACLSGVARTFDKINRLWITSVFLWQFLHHDNRAKNQQDGSQYEAEQQTQDGA